MAAALKVAINVMEISRYRQEELLKHSLDTILKTVCGEAPSQGRERMEAAPLGYISAELIHC